MNNYTILLEQFHLYEQEHSLTHEQYTQIIDYIRNQKLNKQSQITRRKQQKTKLNHRLHRFQQKCCASIPKANINSSLTQESHNLEQINNTILKKQNEELEKQVNKIKKKVNQMQEQLDVFTRKDNQIKQIKYSTKRQLQNSRLQLNNHRMLTFQMEEKHQRVLQQLTMQKSNLEHENRFLADQLKEIKSITRNFMKSGLFLQVHNNCEILKTQELYTKKKIESHLRSLYMILLLKKHWNGHSYPKTFEKIQQQGNQLLLCTYHFAFLSKSQILCYYLNLFNHKSFISLIMTILELYRSITKNISKLQSSNNYLNVKLLEMRQQNQRLDKLLSYLRKNKAKSTTLLIQQFQNNLKQQKLSVCQKSRTIYRIIQTYFKLASKFKSLINTLDSIVDHKTQTKTEANGSDIYCSTPFRKKIDNVCKQKDKRASNIENFKNLSLNKKSSYQSGRIVIAPPLLSGIMAQFQILMFRNPKQVIIQWEDLIKYSQNFSSQFIDTLASNDLFRMFFQPSDYNVSNGELQNQQECTKKVFVSLSNLLLSTHTSLSGSLLGIINDIQQISQKPIPGKNSNFVLSNEGSETKYVIESKGYYRRDNFKLLQKMQLIQMKKKGLYLPYRYGIDFQNQLITQKPQKTQSKAQNVQKLSPNLNISSMNRVNTGPQNSLNKTCSSRLLRLPRNSAPDNSNYISSYRQRINKADRKIRDLLQNADNLRIKAKNNTCNTSRAIEDQMSFRNSFRVSRNKLIQRKLNCA